MCSGSYVANDQKDSFSMDNANFLLSDANKGRGEGTGKRKERKLKMFTEERIEKNRKNYNRKKKQE